MTSDAESRPGAKVLAVDDNPANLNLLTDALSAAGYTVLAATSGEKALQLFRRNPPDLILLSVTMPGMDGYEVCQRLKADEAGCTSFRCTSDSPLLTCSVTS
jgi:CheY-like chemotaxis protein